MLKALITAMFATPNVDKLIGSFITLSDKLRKAQEAHEQRATEVDEQILELEAVREMHDQEADRAARIARQMEEFFSQQQGNQ